ncbi:MAG: hypothetical protein ACHP9Y_01060 [Gammaproteobacteria bacterium]
MATLKPAEAAIIQKLLAFRAQQQNLQIRNYIDSITIQNKDLLPVVIAGLFLFKQYDPISYPGIEALAGTIIASMRSDSEFALNLELVLDEIMAQASSLNLQPEPANSVLVFLKNVSGVNLQTKFTGIASTQKPEKQRAKTPAISRVDIVGNLKRLKDAYQHLDEVHRKLFIDYSDDVLRGVLIEFPEVINYITTQEAPDAPVNMEGYTAQLYYAKNQLELSEKGGKKLLDLLAKKLKELQASMPKVSKKEAREHKQQEKNLLTRVRAIYDRDINLPPSNTSPYQVKAKVIAAEIRGKTIIDKAVAGKYLREIVGPLFLLRDIAEPDAQGKYVINPAVPLTEIYSLLFSAGTPIIQAKFSKNWLRAYVAVLNGLAQRQVAETPLSSLISLMTMPINLPDRTVPLGIALIEQGESALFTSYLKAIAALGPKYAENPEALLSLRNILTAGQPSLEQQAQSMGGKFPALLKRALGALDAQPAAQVTYIQSGIATIMPAAQAVPITPQAMPQEQLAIQIFSELPTEFPNLTLNELLGEYVTGLKKGEISEEDLMYEESKFPEFWQQVVNVLQQIRTARDKALPIHAGDVEFIRNAKYLRDNLNYFKDKVIAPSNRGDIPVKEVLSTKMPQPKVVPFTASGVAKINPPADLPPVQVANVEEVVVDTLMSELAAIDALMSELAHIAAEASTKKPAAASPNLDSSIDEILSSPDSPEQQLIRLRKAPADLRQKTGANPLADPLWLAKYIQGLAVLIQQTFDDAMIDAVRELSDTTNLKQLSQHPDVHTALFSLVIGLLQRPIAKTSLNVMPLLTEIYSQHGQKLAVMHAFSEELLNYLPTASADAGKLLVAQYLQQMRYNIRETSRSSETDRKYNYMSPQQGFTLLFAGEQSVAHAFSHEYMALLEAFVGKVASEHFKDIDIFIDIIRGSQLAQEQKQTLIAQVQKNRPADLANPAQPTELAKTKSADLAASLKSVLTSRKATKESRAQAIWSLFLTYDLANPHVNPALLNIFSAEVKAHHKNIDEKVIFAELCQFVPEWRMRVLEGLLDYQPDATASYVWGSLFFPTLPKSKSWMKKINEEYLRTIRATYSPGDKNELEAQLNNLQNALERVLQPGAKDILTQNLGKMLDLISQAFSEDNLRILYWAGMQNDSANKELCYLRDGVKGNITRLFSRIQDHLVDGFRTTEQKIRSGGLVDKDLAVLRKSLATELPGYLALKESSLWYKLESNMPTILDSLVKSCLMSILNPSSGVSNSEQTEWVCMLLGNNLLTADMVSGFKVEPAVLQGHMREWHSGNNHTQESKHILAALMASANMTPAHMGSFVQPPAASPATASPTIIPASGHLDVVPPPTAKH